MKLLLLGAPGSGKGTFSDDIRTILSIPTISMGALFREEITNDTPIGKEAKKYVEAGINVPDEIPIMMIQKRLAQRDCKKGFILDGFPRNLNQAKALEKMTKLDNVVFFDIPEFLILKRLLGRRVCGNCAKTFNISTYSATACDACGGHLIQRKDDNEKTIKTRIAVDKRETRPLIKYYQEKGILIAVDASRTPEEVKKDVIKALGL